MKNKMCWQDENLCPSEMLRGARGELFPILEKSDHFLVLQYLVNKFIEFRYRDNPDNKLLPYCLELGCGAAEFSRVFKDKFYYVGADLSHIIEKVSKVQNPSNRYIKFDIQDNDLQFLSGFELVVMSAFIDVMEKPLEILEKVLEKSEKYVLIHRQEFCKNKEVDTHVIINPLYGGLTYHSIINELDFLEVLKSTHFRIESAKQINATHLSLLLRRDM